jgi:molybdopterin synthase catalytic subunit
MNRQVIGIEYEIFTELATTVFNQLANEARANIDPLLDLVIINRSGYLQVGEISILIIASSKHRDEAFRACRFIIEEIKHRAPIWKQEHYIDGKSDWVQGHALCQHR